MATDVLCVLAVNLIGTPNYNCLTTELCLKQ
jgi:hypothetical protein